MHIHAPCRPRPPVTHGLLHGPAIPGVHLGPVLAGLLHDHSMDVHPIVHLIVQLANPLFFFFFLDRREREIANCTAAHQIMPRGELTLC